MSDAALPTPTSAATPTPSPKPTESRFRRWRRRLAFAVVAIVLIAVIARGVVNLVLPMILNSIASRYDLNANYERSEIYLSSASVGLWHLKLTPRTESASAIDVGYCRGDVSLLNLLKGNIVIYRAEADGVDARLERKENGECPLLSRLLAGPKAKPQATPAATAAAQRDLDLDPPIRIDSLRASEIRAHITDLSVTPKVDTQLDVSMRLSDVGSTKRPVTFLLDMTSPPLLDSVRVEGTGVAHGKKLDATMQVVVRGIHAKPAAGYLAPLGLSPTGESISLRMSAAVKTEPFDATPVAAGATTQPSGMKGSIVLSDIAAVADGVEAAGLDKLTIGIDQLKFDRIKLGTVSIENVRANARRTPEGNIRVAGLDVVGAPPSSAPEASSPSAPLPAWSVKEIQVRNVKANFEDSAVTPAANLAILIDQAGLKNLASDGSDVPTDIAVQMSIPGIAQSVHASGAARPMGAKKTLDVKLAADGVKLDALRPYLDTAGVESQLKNGVLTCDLSASLAQGNDGKLGIDAKLGNVKFTDGGDLLVFDGLTLAGAAIDPKANRIRIEKIDINGPTVSARRDKTGLVGGLGLIQKPPTAPVGMAAAAAPSTPAPVALTPPTTRPAPVAVASASTVPPLKLEIGKLTWKGAALRFDDQGISPPVSVALSDTGVEASELHIDLDPKAAAGTPGKIQAWLSAPGVAGKVAVSGTLAPTPNALTLELDLAGQNLRAGPLSSYLQALGIKPELRDGSVQSHARIALVRRNGEFSADVAITGVKYADGAQELAGVEALRVNGATLHSDGISVNEIIIDKPRGRAMRDADGTFVVGGARLLATTQPAAPAPLASAAPTTAPAAAPAAKPPVIVVNKLRINDAGLSWIDRAVPRPVDASARVSVQLDNFVFGKVGPPAKFQLTAVVPETIQSVNVTGVVSPALDAPMAKLDVAATGMQEGWLVSYLPPSMKMNLADGRFRVKLDAAAPVVKAGGREVRLVVTDLDYRDGAQGQPLLRFDSAKVLASRVDPVDGKTITVEEISLAGLETAARKAPDGTIHVLGLTLGAPPPQTTFAGAEPTAQTAAAKVPPAPAAPAAPPSTNVAELMAQERTPLPLITLAKLDINLRKVSYIDESRPEASPIALADVNIRNRKPVEALGPDAQSQAPVEIETTGRIDPVVQSFTVAAVTAPFASQPTFVLDINATGIKGDGIVAALPELKSKIDGSGLTDGRFTTHLESAAKFSRRGPLRYDFGKPFDAEFTIRPLEYRGTPDGPVLAGLEEIRGDGIHVDPAKIAVSVRTLELTKPMGNVWRDKEGIHALGLVLKVEAPPTATTTQPSEQSQAVQTPVKVPQVASPTTKPSGEIRIDRLLITGIDFRAEDRTTTPNLIVPLDSLDLEARNISNMAMYEDRPIRFNVVAGAGKVPLQGKGERDLFSEIAANGNISLYPQPRGYAKASVSGFEMLGIAGPANAQKVEIGGGVFDGTFDLRFEDNGIIDTRSRLALTDLKVSEPPDGPVQSSLKLNVPLDAVIIVLEDASGAITLPLHVPIKQGEVSTDAIMDSAAAAAAPIVGTAVASSPLKIAGGVGGMMGMGGKEKETGAKPAGEVDFAPADTQLSAEAQTQVNALIEKMRRQGKLELTLKHEIGGADLVRAAVLANPSAADCAAIAEQIRARKGRLMQSRQQLAATARAQLASGDAGTAQMTIEELRGIDRDLAAAEDALDRVYDLLRPGADRQADRRTRAAALYIAQQRLDAVHAALLSAGVPELDQRIRVTRAQFAQPEKADSEGKITFTVLEKKKP